MNIKHTLLAIIASGCAIGAAAETVSVDEPGTLADILGTDTGITELTINGSVNAADFDFINNKLNALTSLDLSGVTIVAYKGDPVLFNHVEFPGDCLPAFALAGTSVTSLVLPPTLSAIGEGALSSSAIAAIDFTACPSLTAIGEGAFSNCSSLTEVSIPATVTSIGSHAFSRCDNLVKATVGTPAVPMQAFALCPVLEEVVLLAGSVNEIGERAFLGCTGLKQIALPASLRTIGTSAFESTGLTSIDMSTTGVTSIGNWAFAKCPSLSEVVFSDATTTLGEGIFFEDGALVSVKLPDGVSELPAYSFKGSNSVDTANFIHPDIATIGNYALKGMDHVTTFTLPQELSYIGDEGMAGWTSLEILNAQNLTMVPELGNDVWKGVEQSEVHLMTSNKLANTFDGTPQWKEFRIDIVSGIDDITADQVAQSRLKAWFSGTDLNITADTEISDVKLHDIQGRSYLSVNPHDNSIVIDTADFTERIYIVSITFADGTPATVKIAR